MCGTITLADGTKEVVFVGSSLSGGSLPIIFSSSTMEWRPGPMAPFDQARPFNAGTDLYQLYHGLIVKFNVAQMQWDLMSVVSIPDLKNNAIILAVPETFPTCTN